MSSPADVDVNAHLSGVDPVTGGVLAYQAVPILARTIYSNYDGRQPFYTNYGKGNVANSAATYDAITGTALNTATRHIDPYGNVAELHKVWKLLHYWLMDGAPTNMGAIGSPTNRIPLYMSLANQLRPWPTGFTGAAAGEPTQSYPAFPPSAPTTLDSFASKVSTKHAAIARSAFHGVEPVVHHHGPHVKHVHTQPWQDHTGAGHFGSAQPYVDQVQNMQLSEQFTPQAGREHYMAAGYQPVAQGGWNPVEEARVHPGYGQPMHGTQVPLGQRAELSSEPPAAVTGLERIMDKLESIERRLNRAGL